MAEWRTEKVLINYALVPTGIFVHYFLLEFEVQLDPLIFGFSPLVLVNRADETDMSFDSILLFPAHFGSFVEDLLISVATFKGTL